MNNTDRKLAGTEHPADILTNLVKSETLQRLLHRAGLLHLPQCIANLYNGSNYQDQKKKVPTIHQNYTNTTTSHTKKKVATIDNTRTPTSSVAPPTMMTITPLPSKTLHSNRVHRNRRYTLRLRQRWQLHKFPRFLPGT